jgi:hypothetical protein
MSDKQEFDYARHENDMDVIFRFFADRRNADKVGMARGAITTDKGGSPAPVMMMMCAVIAASAYAQTEVCDCKNCATVKKLCLDFSVTADAIMTADTISAWH